MNNRRYLLLFVPVVVLGFALKRAADQRPQTLPVTTRAMPASSTAAQSSAKPRQMVALKVPTQGQQLALTSDGKYLVQGDIGAFGDLSVYDAQSSVQTTIRSPQNSGADAGTQYLEPVPGTHLVAGTGTFQRTITSSSILLFDLDKSSSKVLAVGKVRGPALAASPGGSEIAAFDAAGALCFWDIKTGQLKRHFGDFRGPLLPFQTETVRKNAPELVGKLKSPPPMALAFSPDGKTLAMGGLYYEGSFTHTSGISDAWLCDATNGRKLRDLALPTSDQMGSNAGPMGWSSFVCTSLVFSPDGRAVATDSHGDGVVIWEAKTGAIRHVLQHPVNRTGNTVRHLYGGAGVTFSPDSQLIAAASNTGTVDVWNAKSGQLTRQLRASGPTAFLPDGRLITRGIDGGGHIMVWKVP